MKTKAARSGYILIAMLTLILFFQNCGKNSFEVNSNLALNSVSLSSTVLPSSGVPALPVDLGKLITDSVFAPTSFWYTPIPIDAPVHANSANMVQDFIQQRNTYYNSVGINTTSYSSPIFYVDANAPTVKVTPWDCQNKGYLDATLSTMWAQVPIPANAQASAGSDMEMSVYQPSTDTLWEFWKMRKNTSGDWEGCWGGRLQNVSKAQGQFTGSYGTTATSLSFIGGQITAEELRRGEIRHAIGVAMVNTTSASLYSWPAHRSDGNGAGTIPEGLRFRLDPSLDIDSLNIHPIAKIIAKAGQKYGFVVWDRAGAVSIRMQNAISYTSLGEINPYPALFNGTLSYAILNGVPWDRLQFLPLNYGKP